MQLSIQEVLTRARQSTKERKYPGKDDERMQEGWAFPYIAPRFTVSSESKIFTIGSCFARNIEAELEGFDLPTTRFAVPKEEWDQRPNGLLNEFNPGTMAQRMKWALDQVDTSIIHATYQIKGEQVDDLYLRHCNPVSLERAVERRKEIDAIYSHMATSQLVIITLGLVECWYDNLTQTYLNQMPYVRMALKEPDRYVLKRLTVDESYSLLAPCFQRITDLGIRILITVSPVPLMTTFSGRDCVAANCYSKSSLRSCAEMLADDFETLVDYYPSYEIVISGGPQSFIEDNIHVHPDLVRRITRHMTSFYIERQANGSRSSE